MNGRLYIVNETIKRDHTENDVADLRNTFEEFGTHVEEVDKSSLKIFCKTLQKFNFSDVLYVAVVIMAHGAQNDAAIIEGQTIEIQKTFLLPMCSNKSLNGKLKLLILQTCRGSFDFMKETAEGPSKALYPEYYVKLFSTSEGAKSYRMLKKQRSIFIEHLCKQIRSSYKNTDLLSIMESTHKEVKEFTESKYNIIQTPSFESNLGGKKFYFTSGIQ